MQGGRASGRGRRALSVAAEEAGMWSHLSDAILAFLGSAILLIAGWIAAAYRHLRLKQADHAERITKLETRMDDIPKRLWEVVEEIKGLRKDSAEGRRELYGHIDRLRLELKQDLASKADK